MVIITGFILRTVAVLVGLANLSLGDQMFQIPVTLYQPTVKNTSNNRSDYNYCFSATLRQNALAGATQLKVIITLPDNPTWDPRESVILCQISNTKDAFGPNNANMTIQNFAWGTNPDAFPTMVIDLDRICADLNDCTLYGRLLGYDEAILYSIAFTFVNNQAQSFFPYSDKPFDGPIVSGKTPKSFGQYWRTTELVTAAYKEYTYFLFGYCDQGAPVNSIQVSAEAPPGYETTLLEQWACSQSIGKYQDCTNANAVWPQNNFPEAPINIITCDDQTKSLAPGIIVTIKQVGPGINGNGTFTLAATLNSNNLDY